MLWKVLVFGLGMVAGWAGPEWVLALLVCLLAPEVAGTMGALARRAARRR